MKTLLSVAFGCTVGAIAALTLIHLGHLSGGLVIAVAAGAVLLVEGANAVRRSRQRERDKARHPSTYARVDYEYTEKPAWPYLKPWPIGDDEVRS